MSTSASGSESATMFLCVSCPNHGIVCASATVYAPVPERARRRHHGPRHPRKSRERTDATSEVELVADVGSTWMVIAQANSRACPKPESVATPASFPCVQQFTAFLQLQFDERNIKN